MARKCEHGLTPRECLVCVSPRYGASTGDQMVMVTRARLAELEELERTVLREVNALAQAAGFEGEPMRENSPVCNLNTPWLAPE